MARHGGPELRPYFGCAAQAEGAGDPAQGLWAMLPGITAEQLAMWERLVEEDPDQVLISAIQKGTEAAQRPDGQQPTDPNQEQTAADPELE